MPDRGFELLTGGRKVVRWQGTDGEDAARRYVDCKGGVVIAWREIPWAFVPGVDARQIIG